MRPFSDVDLHAFVDGQISPERRALVEAYLKTTPSEAARVDQWRRQNEAIRSLFAGAASEAVPLWLTIGQVASGRERPRAAGLDPIQDNRARQPTSRSGGALPSRSRMGRAWTPACLALAAFAAGLALPYAMPAWPNAMERWLPATPRMAQLGRLADRTLEAHRIFGSDPETPVEIDDTPPGALAAWFKLRIGIPVRVPDLKRAGWTLRGGRIVPGDLGRAAALMIYENLKGDRLSLVESPVENVAPADTTYAVLKGPGLVWLDGPVGFGIASSKEGSWLSDNARVLYRAVYEGTTD